MGIPQSTKLAQPLKHYLGKLETYQQKKNNKDPSNRCNIPYYRKVHKNNGLTENSTPMGGFVNMASTSNLLEMPTPDMNVSVTALKAEVMYKGLASTSRMVSALVTPIGKFEDAAEEFDRLQRSGMTNS